MDKWDSLYNLVEILANWRGLPSEPPMTEAFDLIGALAEWLQELTGETVEVGSLENLQGGPGYDMVRLKQDDLNRVVTIEGDNLLCRIVGKTDMGHRISTWTRIPLCNPDCFDQLAALITKRV